jgi:hypothetical protein
MFTKYGWNTNPYNPETNSYDPPGTPTPPAWEQYLRQTGQTDLIRSGMPPPPPPNASSAASVLARQVIRPFVANCSDGRMRIDRNKTNPLYITFDEYNAVICAAQDNTRLEKSERLTQSKIGEKLGIAEAKVSAIVRFSSLMFIGPGNK